MPNAQARHQDLRLAVATAAALLAMSGAYAYRRASAVQPGASASYHENIVAVAATMPKQIGPWIGEDTPLEEGAMRILHPNMALSRRFTDVTKGWSVDLLILHVRDARDILGHYPPVCYPSMGWSPVAVSKTDWDVAGRRIAGVEYEFSRGGLGGLDGSGDAAFEAAHGARRADDKIVDNFLVVRGQDFCRDMDEVSFAARDPSKRIYGAAQVQIVCPAAMPPEQRQEAFRELIAGNIAVIDAIRVGEARGGETHAER